MSTIIEFKEFLLSTGLFKAVTGNNGWYRCKVCPYCGDAKWHLYVRIDLNDDSPVGYNCFKRNCKGVIDQRFLDFYGLEWKKGVPRGKRSRKVDHCDDALKEDVLGIDVNPDYVEKCRQYIFHRVGVLPTDDELRMFGVVGNVNGYVDSFLSGRINSYSRRCWFRCTNGQLIGRGFRDNEEWMKFSGGLKLSRALYSIRKPFDILGNVNVCICEGVMDAIGLYYHGGIENAVYIACLGRDYMSGVKYILDKGIFGDSVMIRIYKDADVDRVEIDKFKCQFFKGVSVYVNAIGKDYGVHGDLIEIEREL